MIDRVLYLIKAYNIKASKLCEDLSISSSSITDWKKGKGTPSIDTARKISRYFNVSLEWLITGQVNGVEISVEDCELLDAFHKLNSIGKAELRGYLYGILTNKKYIDISQNEKRCL